MPPRARRPRPHRRVSPRAHHPRPYRYVPPRARRPHRRPPAITRMAAKKSKKPAEANPNSPRQGQPSTVFPPSMTGSKPKVPSAASELKTTRQAEAEAKKRKLEDTSDDAPSKKKLKTKGSKYSRKEHAAAPDPLIVEPIYVALPASANYERRLVVHEPSSTEAPENEEVPAADPNPAEDIGCEDNVNDDEVLPQLEPIAMVSSPAPTSNELISIGCPMTPRPMMPITRDMPMDDETILRTPPTQVTTPVLETQQESPDAFDSTIPSPQASPSFRRLHRGPMSQASMSSIPEEDVQPTGSVARQVFPNAIPSATAQESKAKAAEDIPAASTDEEREVTPLPVI